MSESSSPSDRSTWPEDWLSHGPAHAGCTCAGCAGLRRELAGDDELLELYSRKLLQQGWAGGQPTEAERKYRGAHYKGAGNPTPAQLAARAAFSERRRKQDST